VHTIHNQESSVLRKWQFILTIKFLKKKYLKPLINMEVFLELLEEIHKMEIIKVTKGHFVSTGSFVAYDESGNEYFANKPIVEINKNLYDALSHKQFLWVLVKEEIWTGKYTGKKMVINTISETKEGCQQFKINKLSKLLLKEKIHEIHELQLKDIRNKFKNIEEKIKENPFLIINNSNLDNPLEESKYDKIQKIIQKELGELNNITPFNC